MGVVYDDIESFSKYKKHFKRFKTVKVTKTKYSIKIDYGKKKVLLNKGGNEGTNVLGLVNRVKRDAKNYIENVEIKKMYSNDIYWSYYNHNKEVDKLESFDVAKIDLTSAYWTKAINCGLLSKETIDYFEKINFKDVKDKKGGRLKALGSLATVKSTEVYEYGKRSGEYQELIVNENFRSLYMGICNEVANDMKTVLSGVDGIFYYWDCIWVEPQHEERVKELFKSMGYNCTVEKHKAFVVKQKYISYLCCPNKKGELINYYIKN